MLNPNNPDIPALIALSKVFAFDAEKFRDTLETFDHPASYFSLHGKEYLLEEAKKEAAELTVAGVQFTIIGDDAFPKRLEQTKDVPPFLYVKSASPVKTLFNKERYVSVIGTRDPSGYGYTALGEVMKALAQSNVDREEPLTVVSGLAVGIDITAHRNALELGIPTIAVLPTDIMSVYPKSHSGEAEKIATSPRCALVTCFAPGTAPEACNFLYRNRIIAALSDDTVLIESKARGGGNMTAMMAHSYGRRVFAVPGRMGDPRSAGCNHLIRTGVAQLLEDATQLI